MTGARKKQANTSLPYALWKRIEVLFKTDATLAAHYGSYTAYIVQATLAQVEKDEARLGIVPTPKV